MDEIPDGAVVSIKIGDSPWREQVVGQDGFSFSMGLSSDGADFLVGKKPSLWKRFRRWLSSALDINIRFDGDLLTPAHPDDPSWHDDPIR
jgi:hypothetical protein